MPSASSSSASSFSLVSPSSPSLSSSTSTSATCSTPGEISFEKECSVPVVQGAEGKKFNKRELDFEAKVDDYVVVYPDIEEESEGYRFWLARAHEPISYEVHKRKKATAVYYVAKGNTEYLQFEEESSKKKKIKFNELVGCLNPSNITQVSDTQMTITEEERNKWSQIALELDGE